MENGQKRALVCGGGGFIGSHLAKRLKNEGYFVRVVDLKRPEYSETVADDFVLGDLRDRELCFSLFDDGDFDEVYQLAADMGGAGYVFTGEHDTDIMHNSAMINLHFVELGKLGKYKKLFYSSSACMYPEHNQMDPENPMCAEHSAYPANPDSEYGWEKLFSERMYLALNRNYGVAVRIARLHNIFGPEGTWRGGREKAPAAICRKVAEADDGGEIAIWGDGKQTRSFLYVDECLEGIRRLMSQDDFIGSVNIGSEEMVTINQLVDLTCEIADKKLAKKHIDGPLGVRGRNSDNKLIKEKLGWEPHYKLSDGLRKTYAWIQNQVEKAQKEKLKISIVTVSYNADKTIRDTIESVLNQSYKNVEYIVVDGLSKDKTMDIVRSYGERIQKVISEKDEGIYDAMNKGIAMATGDIVGILNSDDYYGDEDVLALVAKAFEDDKELGCVYGDLDYVDQNDTSKVVRAWRSREYSPELFKTGWHPAHPTFFVRKSVYDKYGVFRKELGISADYELMLRFMEKEGVKARYISHLMVKMRTGGNSGKSLGKIVKGNLEVLESWRKNKMKVPYHIFVTKPVSKIKQLIVKKDSSKGN